MGHNNGTHHPSLAESVRGFFSPAGALAGAKGYESRSGQASMAEKVAEVIEAKRHLVVEAGTGTGKSLAYLVPAAYAAESGRKAIVSTYTIHLQEQLFGKDVPIVQSLVPFEFTAALLKGRQNYLCPHRLRKAQAQQGELFATGQAEQLKGLVEWAGRTRDGTLSDLDFSVDAAVWAQV
ncbi:MAG: ATP-dependent DNA helicase, partial [Verrucomicrobia bacterium]|nr:ATP-dependent DNA helicase [Verrucomicrobiota bacterium]